VFEESMFDGVFYGWRTVCAKCLEVLASGGQ